MLLLLWYIGAMSNELNNRNWVATKTILDGSEICYVSIRSHHLQISFIVKVVKGKHESHEIYNRLKGDVVIGPTEMVELILANLD